MTSQAATASKMTYRRDFVALIGRFVQRHRWPRCRLAPIPAWRKHRNYSPERFATVKGNTEGFSCNGASVGTSTHKNNISRSFSHRVEETRIVCCSKVGGWGLGIGASRHVFRRALKTKGRDEERRCCTRRSHRCAHHVGAAATRGTTQNGT